MNSYRITSMSSTDELSDCPEHLSPTWLTNNQNLQEQTAKGMLIKTYDGQLLLGLHKLFWLRL